MPWAKQFDVDAAQRRARDLFWSRGYERTSMDELLGAMGIGRSSFYATFGSKEQVYAAALEQYDREQRRAALDDLRATLPARAAIVRLFELARDDGCGPDGSRGCFLANAALELGAAAPEVGTIVRRAFAETEAFFAERIEAARDSGDVGHDVDVLATSRSLVALLIGMRVLARAGAPREALDAIVTQVDRQL